MDSRVLFCGGLVALCVLPVLGCLLATCLSRTVLIHKVGKRLRILGYEAVSVCTWEWRVKDVSSYRVRSLNRMPQDLLEQIGLYLEGKQSRVVYNDRWGRNNEILALFYCPPPHVDFDEGWW